MLNLGQDCLGEVLLLLGPEDLVCLRLTCWELMQLEQQHIAHPTETMARAGLVHPEDAWKHSSTKAWARQALLREIQKVPGIGPRKSPRILAALEETKVPFRALCAPFEYYVDVPFPTGLALSSYFDPLWFPLDRKVMHMAINHLMKSSGDTAKDWGEWVQDLSKLLGTEHEATAEALATQGHLRGSSLYQSKHLWAVEQSIAREVRDMKELIGGKWEHCPHLDESQNKAAAMVTANRLSIITGGPGSGKTTTIRSLIDAFAHEGPVLLLAPSHCARIRIQQQTGYEAQTVQHFTTVSVPVLESTFVVVDESSMVDCHQFLCLLRNVRGANRVVLMGDANQVESPGLGCVFEDLIDSGVVPTAVLRFNHRSNPSISGVADRILSGDTALPPCFVPVRNAEEAMAVLESSSKLQYRCIAFHSDVSKILCTTNINHRCTGKEFVVGQVVISVITNKDNGQFNGASGVLVTKLSHGWTVQWAFGGFSDVAEQDIQAGVAMTGHMAQGSEFDNVAVVIPVGLSRAHRRWLYTAVTRAKKNLLIVGRPSDWKAAVQQLNRRRTLLLQKLCA